MLVDRVEICAATTHQYLATAIVQTEASVGLEAMDNVKLPTFTRTVCKIEWLGGIVAASNCHIVRTNATQVNFDEIIRDNVEP